MRPLAVQGMLILVALAAVPDAARSVPQPVSGPRLVVVLGDLHLGVGRESGGGWHSTEDFRWADEFGLFLSAVDDEGQGATDLILNGDTFELWQSRERDCVYADATLGCTEAEALARLERVLAAHTSEIAALGAFAGSGSNRVVLVPGDHDAALLFPAVGRRVVEALGAPAGRVEVAFDGYWRSADGQLYAEHGHQIGSRADGFENWPSPFIRRAGREHLVRPWGEQVVQGLFNRLEPRYPVVDNLADEGAGVNYGVAAEGPAEADETVPQLLRYVLFRMPWQQFRVNLDGGDVASPLWDLAEVRAEGAAFLVASLPDDDPFQPLALKALDAGRLAGLMDDLSDEELVALCDYRAAVRRARRRFERVVTQLDPLGPPGAECPRTPATRGAAFEYFWRSRDLPLRRHLEALRERLPPTDHTLAVVVRGHTHLAAGRPAFFTMSDRGELVAVNEFSLVREVATPVDITIINGGAWQRTLTPRQLGELTQERGASYADLLRTLQPEQLAPCYSFVRVDPYTGAAPRPALRFWVQAEDGTWAMRTRCGLQPSG